MAKKQADEKLTADEAVEVSTLEASVAEEAAAPTFDERVAAVFEGHAGAKPLNEMTPTEILAEAEREGRALTFAETQAFEKASWQAEAAEILSLTGAGTPVSPARVTAALSRAVGLVPKA